MNLSYLTRCIWLAAAIIAFAAQAQSYPTKPVRLLAPYPPGSGADVIGRIYTVKLTESLGKQFVVDNRAGAAGNIAAELVARANPDGYTMLLLNTSIVSSQSLYKNLPYDIKRDFQAIGMLGVAPYILVVNNSLPVKSVSDMISLAKSKPGNLSYASTGVGGALHLTMEMLISQTGIKAMHVPYKGSSTTVPDLIGGQIDMMFGTTLSLMPHVKSARMRAIGITSTKRSSGAPEIPTIAESGVSGFESSSWFMLVAPAKVPRNIINLLNDAIAKTAQMPEVNSILSSQSAERLIMTPEQATTHILNELEKWRKVIAAAGVKGE